MNNYLFLNLKQWPVSIMYLSTSYTVNSCVKGVVRRIRCESTHNESTGAGVWAGGDHSHSSVR